MLQERQSQDSGDGLVKAKRKQQVLKGHGPLDSSDGLVELSPEP